MSDQEYRHLRVIPDLAPFVEAQQLTLPFDSDAFVFAFANVTNATEQGFLDLLAKLQPNIIVDLRIVPRFDFGRLNRKVVFRMLEEISALYHDLPYALGVSERNDARLNPALVADPLARMLEQGPPPNRILMLFEDAVSLDSSLDILPKRLKLEPKDRWRFIRAS